MLNEMRSNLCLNMQVLLDEMRSNLCLNMQVFESKVENKLGTKHPWKRLREKEASPRHKIENESRNVPKDFDYKERIPRVGSKRVTMQLSLPWDTCAMVYRAYSTGGIQKRLSLESKIGTKTRREIPSRIQK